MPPDRSKWLPGRAAVPSQHSEWLIGVAPVPPACIMANGQELAVDQEIDLVVKLNGHRVPVTFSELSISCPIPSVGRIVQRANKVVFNDNRIYILKKATGIKIEFVQGEGMYFLFNPARMLAGVGTRSVARQLPLTPNKTQSF